MASFADALNRRAEDIRRPPPPPIGHYVMQVAKMPGAAEPMNSARFTGEKLTVQVTVVSALDDVDQDELADFGNVAGFPLRLDFIFNTDPNETMKFEQTLNRLKTFCTHCGIDEEGKSLGEMLAELPNAQFVGELKHRTDPNDSESIYPEIGRTTAFE